MSGPWSNVDDPHYAFVLSALFSCFLSLLVVITYLIFPQLKSKVFMKIITLISLCDCIANASELNGIPNTREFCVIQGVVMQFFYPASWIWTVILTYLLYSLVIDGKISMPEWKMHAIAWGLSTLITVLPLTTSTYGKQDGDNYWCFIQPSKRVPGTAATEFWQYLMFDALIFVCFLLMLSWGILIYYKLGVQEITASKIVLNAVRTLFIYPWILFFTWFPNVLLFTLYPSYPQDSDAWLVVQSLSIWQGGLTAMVFFYNSRESRMLWYGLLTKCCGRKVDSTLTERMTSDRITGTTTEDMDFESDDAYYGRTDDNSEPSRQQSDVFTNNNPMWGQFGL